ncbi:S8 family serine peptidase [Chitinophaga sp. Cy-1792]|uniref:S8 family serine peptidase n=1 Tax=Chitinophaga sp. Cy-1792 TaxID=2608339 RepID=UPI001423768A|nr:S8 family serine peptidase [Chitinophaga sp. Cy-1792]NIG54476.1 S8 family serine peptidase [Chitinophaga sp. Cy-1792]
MRILLFVAFVLLQIPVLAQEKFSYSTKKGNIEFTISSSEYYVAFSDSNRMKALTTLTPHKTLNTAKNTAIISIDLPDTDVKTRISKLTGKLNNAPKQTEPVLIYKDGTRQICTGEIIVKFVDTAYLQTLRKVYNIAVSRDTFVNKQYIITLEGSSTQETFGFINQLNESKYIDFAEPNFIRLFQPFTADPLYQYQWAIKNQGYLGGTPGADMHVENAWNIATGQGIKVAIIDEGVDLNHPDLAANLLGGFDATGNNSGGAPSGDDAHGTACAGIVAAIANNYIGTTGVAYNSKVIPVRIGRKGDGTSPWTTDAWASNGITWAKNSGADILSNSWGGGSPSNAITNAINDAVNNGRNGKGCVVLFAAGNYNTAISYPSTLSNVIAVGASSMCDTRKRSSNDPLGVSCDGETTWGSNYGPGLDILAPGVKIYTTDISGYAGYSFDDYTSTFNGTSSATPNAAAVMALILSVNPGLTGIQARQLLESTCDKVGGYNYQSNVSGQPNGTWCGDAGYGRINACAAVAKTLQSMLSIDGPAQFCTSANYKINGLASGTTVTWASSDPSIVTLDANGNASKGWLPGGNVTITATINTACAAITVSKTVSVGAPAVTINAVDGKSCEISISCSATGNPTSYNFHTYNYDNGSGYQTNNTGHFNVYSSGEGTYKIGVSATNSCGTGLDAVMLTNVTCSDFYKFAISPNPATNIVNISPSQSAANLAARNTSAKSADLSISQVNIYDQSGNLKHQQKYSNSNASEQVNISNLGSGVYFLEIVTKTNKERQIIIVK